MKTKKRKAVIDDGCNPELVAGARFDGSYYQRHGVYVIPQIRWGTELTYTTKYFPEKVAFLGAEKHSIVAVGTYGCIQHREDKYYFQAGLEAMLETLEPEIVLVYGAMPESVFGSYLHLAKFVQYDNWTTSRHYPCLEERVSNKVAADKVSETFADNSLLAAAEPDGVSLIRCKCNGQRQKRPL